MSRARRRLVGALALPLAAGALATTPAPVQADVPVVAAGPGASRGAGYATKVMAVRVGDRPSVVNFDVVWHDLVSSDAGPDDRPWCLPLDPSKPEHPATNPRRYPRGQCPLFWADAATAAGGRSVVEGLEAVVPGRVYEFRCTVVPGMTGNFFVVS